MKIQSKVFRRKSGKNEGCWVARLHFEDETGRVRYVERHAESKGAANDLRDKLADELKRSHGHTRVGDKMSFNDLADYCEKHYYKPASYVNGRKISGVRSVAGVRSALKALREHFGAQRIRAIHPTSIQAFKEHRLATPVKIQSNRGDGPVAVRPRKIASVNRELTIMRRMMKIAISEGWILKDPFAGAQVISPADETRRERILTRDEEIRLLAACSDGEKIVTNTRAGKPFTQRVFEKRSHLKPLIILALDTGMRRGELFKLGWSQVDFQLGVIFVSATHTKSQRERIVPLTSRSRAALLEWRQANHYERIFPFVDVKNAFKAVKQEAALLDVRFHDLRHTAITRMIRGGISAAEVGKIAGHSQPNTTYRYINNDVESIRTVANILDLYSIPPTAAHDLDDSIVH
jgi:integrase